MLFQPPDSAEKKCFSHLNSNLAVLAKLKGQQQRRVNKGSGKCALDIYDLLPQRFDEAKKKTREARPFFKTFSSVYLSFKEAMRILKMKLDV
jgi:hypothetical protein